MLVTVPIFMMSLPRRSSALNERNLETHSFFTFRVRAPSTVLENGLKPGFRVTVSPASNTRSGSTRHSGTGPLSLVSFSLAGNGCLKSRVRSRLAPPSTATLQPVTAGAAYTPLLPNDSKGISRKFMRPCLASSGASLLPSEMTKITGSSRTDFRRWLR